MRNQLLGAIFLLLLAVGGFSFALLTLQAANLDGRVWSGRQHAYFERGTPEFTGQMIALKMVLVFTPAVGLFGLWSLRKSGPEPS